MLFSKDILGMKKKEKTDSIDTDCGDGCNNYAVRGNTNDS